MTPLGLRREFDPLEPFQDLLREQAVDGPRSSLHRLVTSAIRRVSAWAEAYYTAVDPYHDGGPVPLGTAAGLHLAVRLPTFVALRGHRLGVSVDERALDRSEFRL